MPPVSSETVVPGISDPPSAKTTPDLRLGRRQAEPSARLVRGPVLGKLKWGPASDAGDDNDKPVGFGPAKRTQHRASSEAST
ncbi:hypothetical protein ACLOJK_026942 [Asimina triloba]